MRDRGRDDTQSDLGFRHFVTGTVLTFTVVSKCRCSIAVVTHALEGALCVPALAMSAEMVVLAFINICEQDSTKECRVVLQTLGHSFTQGRSINSLLIN